MLLQESAPLQKVGGGVHSIDLKLIAISGGSGRSHGSHGRGLRLSLEDENRENSEGETHRTPRADREPDTETA